MSILSLSSECLSEILSFLNNKYLYRCLFINRYFCKLSISMLWKDPFKDNSLVINTLLSCLNEDEISSLIPCAIIFPTNQSPLFEYGKFVRIIDHNHFIKNIIEWLYPSNGQVDDKNREIDGQDCKVQKLIHVIYHMIMRQGSSLQKFYLINFEKADLPESYIFTNYKPGITNLSTFYLILKSDDIIKYQNAFKFLNTVSTSCNGIVECALYFMKCTIIKPIKAFLDIIKLQPLEHMLIYNDPDYSNREENFKKIIYALEFRSETLKELKFFNLNFQGADLSFISKLKYLESFVITGCNFTPQHCDSFSRKKFHLKKLELSDCKYDSILVIEKIISSLVGKSLHKLTLCIFTLEIFKALKESSPNISFLHICSDLKDLILVIPYICDLTSLKILHLEDSVNDYINGLLVAKALGDYLTSVEYLYMDFHIDEPSFKYFASKCKAHLKRWFIILPKTESVIFYLVNVFDYQAIHNSLKVFGIMKGDQYKPVTQIENFYIEILKGVGVEVVLDNYYIN